jgi:cytochrome P450
MLDVEIGSRQFIENQHHYLDQLKATTPIVKTKSGYILSTKYDDIFSGLKNNAFARQIVEVSDSHYHALTNLDGKDHSKYRQMLSSTFSNSSIKNIEKFILGIIDEEINNIKKSSSKNIDLIKDIAFKVPFYTTCKILGVEPPEDEDLSRIQKLSVDTLLVLNLDLSKEEFRKSLQSCDELLHFIINLTFGNKYKKKSGLITHLQNTEIEGKNITNEEILTFIILLFVAGFETNVNSITSSLYNILNQNTVKDQILQLDTSSIALNKMSDELIRHSSSINFVTRKAIEDTYIGKGENKFLVKEGEIVLFHLGSANRDLQIFEDPHNIDIHRHNASRHLGFSSGPHYCIGANLSKIQVSNVVVQMLKSFNNLKIMENPVLSSNFGFTGFEEIYATYE